MSLMAFSSGDSRSRATTVQVSLWKEVGMSVRPTRRARAENGVPALHSVEGNRMGLEGGGCCVAL